ncbi:MAG: helix-turn-helix domain-containing protein [Eubacterium sp.]|nr:helix-turn-helix domain-containing protein [Eubacterium sp.]MCM1219249.1 helix-turn-helix domain-containing protein [Lachnospiraceae bacterium]MCM1241033.1 helix-turn-helix domain-containing protein [Lachnospiraceae bacterium]
MINETLLSNIRELCKKNGISVADLEKKLGIGAGTISRWNKANPSFDKITAIAQYFNVSIDELSGYRARSEPQNHISEETAQIIDYLTKKTMENEGNQTFWQDYMKRSDDFELMVDGLPSMNTDINPDIIPEMSRLFYAYDEVENYLLEVFYCMNKDRDCETHIHLYLVPDESEKPELECGDKQALQQLYITVSDRMKLIKTQMNAQKKRSELLKMIHGSMK